MITRVVLYIVFYFYSLMQHHSADVALQQGLISNTRLHLMLFYPYVIVLLHACFTSLLHPGLQDIATYTSNTENAQTLLIKMNL